MSSTETPAGASSRAPFIYLSAGLGTDIEPVSIMLSQGEFRPMQWTQASQGGFAHGLVSTLSKCAALVAVVDQPVVGPAVILEVGVALGRGLPVVVLAMSSDAAAGIGPVLQELPTIVVTGDLSATSTRITETLHALIDAQSAEPGTGLRATRPVRGTASARGFAFEMQVAAILEEHGARVVPELPDQAGNSGHDLAIWVDGLPHPSLNPVLIEVKQRLREGSARDQTSDVVKQLQAALAAHRCVLGLIIVGGEREPVWHITSESVIATIGADTLARKNLAGLLNDGRNRWVHRTE